MSAPSLVDALVDVVPTPRELAADMQARATVDELAETLDVLGELVVVEHRPGMHSLRTTSGTQFAAWPFGAYVGCAYKLAGDAALAQRLGLTPAPDLPLVDTWWERVRAVQHVTSELWT